MTVLYLKGCQHQLLIDVDKCSFTNICQHQNLPNMWNFKDKYWMN